MNFNCLLHPEIEATRHQGELGSGNSNNRIGHQDSVRGEAIPSEPSWHHVPAAELNLSQGLAGSLIDSILETRIRDDARNGVNRKDNRRKRVETAVDVINARKKRYSACLHVSAQRYLLGPDVIDDQEARHLEQHSNNASERLEKKLQEFRALKSKVTAIRALEKRTSGEDMTVAQFKTMVTWYKRSGDLPIPATRALLLQQLNATVGRDDPTEPDLPSARHSPTAVVATAATPAEPAEEQEVTDEAEDSGVMILALNEEL
jgi:hypothetical protein